MSAPRGGRSARRGGSTFASQPASRLPNGTSSKNNARLQRGDPPSKPSVRPSTQQYQPPHRGLRTQTTSTRGREQPSAPGRTTTSKQTWRRTENAGNSDYKQRIEELFQQLRADREKERAEAIRNGLLADPNKRTRLEDAITVVGTCEDMCPQFERIQRIREAAVEGPEKTTLSSGSKVPSEELMVKCFHRSDAGKDEQLPSDLRPPKVLQKTLDYLFDEILSGPEPLANVHKFLWDRTRAIRNDFSIQQVSRVEDLKIAIDCFERIARFHLLSLHQLTHPTRNNGDFVPQQEREQLSNTLVSLMYYYDDSRSQLQSPNEAEFRAYSITLEVRARSHDLKARVQSLPRRIVQDSKVQTAMKLHAASGKMRNVHNMLSPLTRTFNVAKGDYATFWSILRSGSTTYLMACAAEVAFNFVRARTLETMERAFKTGNSRPKLEDFTLDDLTAALAFDDYEQTRRFLEEAGFNFRERTDGDLFLDLDGIGAVPIDAISRREQIFSEHLVESKRKHRAFKAIANGFSVQRCKEEGLIDEDSEDESEESLFVSSPGSPERDASPPPVQVGREVKPLTASNPFAGQQATTPDPFEAAKNNATSGFFRNPSSSAVFGGAAGPTAPSPFQALQSSLTSSSSAFKPPPLSNQQIANSVFGSGALTNHTSKGLDAKPAQANQNMATTFNSISQGSPFGSLQLGQDKPASLGSVFGNSIRTLSNSAGAKTTLSSSIGSSTHAGKSFFDRMEQPKPQAEATESKNTNIQGSSVLPNTPFSQGFNPTSAFNFPTFDNTPNTTSSPNPFAPPSGTPASNASSNTAFSPSTLANDKTRIENVNASEDQDQSHSKQAQQDFGSFLGASSAKLSQSSFAPGATEVEKQSPATSQKFFPSKSFPKAFHEDQLKPKLGDATFSNTVSANDETSPAPPASFTAANQTNSASSLTAAFPSPFLPDTSAPFVAPTGTPSQQPTVPLSRTGPLSPSIKQKQQDEKLRHEQQAKIRSEAIGRLSQELTCGEYGLIEQIVEHLMEGIFDDCAKTLRREQRAEKKAVLRRNYLSKKYLTLWRDRAWKLRLKRKAVSRRQTLARTVKELTLDAEESRNRSVTSSGSNGSTPQANGAIPLGSLLIAPHRFHTVNAKQSSSTRKRKEVHDSDRQSSKDLLDDAVIEDKNTLKRRKFAHHKRSKTMGISLPAVTSGQDSTSSDRLRVSLSNKRKRLSHSDSLMSDAVLNRARHLLGKTDTTRTDYFRLKALGIDPSTPAVPESLRRSRASLTSTTNSPAPSSSALTNNVNGTLKSTPKNLSTLALSMQTREMLASRSQSSSSAASPDSNSNSLAFAAADPAAPPRSTPKLTSEEEDLFAQARRLREALAEDEAWFRHEREGFESKQKARLPPEGETEKQRRLREWQGTPSRTSVRLERTGASGLLPPDWKTRREGRKDDEADGVNGADQKEVDLGQGRGKKTLSEGGSGEMPAKVLKTGLLGQQQQQQQRLQQQQQPRGFAALANGFGQQPAGAGLRKQSPLAAKGASADDAIEL